MDELNPNVNHGNWLITHGTGDELLPVETTRAQIDMLNNADSKSITVSIPKRTRLIWSASCLKFGDGWRRG
jgi:hypothetical protein